MGCGGNQVESVGEFLLQDAVFMGHEGNGTVLELIESKAQIINSVFLLNGKTGGVIISFQSTIDIQHSIFKDNINVGRYGGAILAQQNSNVTMISTLCINNTATKGGVLYSDHSTIIFEDSEFLGNTAWEGGVLSSIKRSNITINGGRFNNNIASLGGGGALHIQYWSTITIVASNFDGNDAGSGGALSLSYHSVVKIKESEFHGNTALTGGALNIELNSITAINCSEFNGNTAELNDGGVLHSYDSNITITASRFDSNTGGVINSILSTVVIVASGFDGNKERFEGDGIEFEGGILKSQHGNVTLCDSVFTNNNCTKGAVIYGKQAVVTQRNSLLIAYNNIAENYAVVYLANSELIGHYSGNLTLSNNLGSLFAFSSNISFMGYVVFVNNRPSQTVKNNFQQAGGSITLFQSNLYFDGICLLEYNNAENGGAILSIESKIIVNGDVTIAHNNATSNGGGIYLSQSQLSCLKKSSCLLLNNTAIHSGGGIHAIGSSIRADSDAKYINLLIINIQFGEYTGTTLNFTGNTAGKGGALSLEANAKLYILKYASLKAANIAQTYTVIFKANIADYGGAVYVDDGTNPGTCASVLRAECFFQVLGLHKTVRTFTKIEEESMVFLQNQAAIAGPALYGGLLDRCSVSPIAEIRTYAYMTDYTNLGDGLQYFKNVSTVDYYDNSILSHPVRVCLCTGDIRIHHCINQSYREVKKGEIFNISLVAVDQTGNPINGTIQALFNFTESGLAEGQLTRDIPGECTALTFNVVSPHNSKELTLFASDGPCKDEELSKGTITLQFLPCICPIGFQVSGKVDINCTCECHRNISDYVEECDSQTGTLFRQSQSTAWISYINYTEQPGYLVYANCPFDYCNLFSLPMDLNLPNGSDAQCAFKRSSLLCGSCQPDLSLSLGSSRCLSCPKYWPALFLIITLAAILAGIALVTLLLVLNMTVAIGTLNGMIFYANINFCMHTKTLCFHLKRQT